MIGDILPSGYDENYDYKNKRQLLGDIVGTAGDIVGDLTPFSYGGDRYDADSDHYDADGDRYDADEDYKVKRQVEINAPELLPEVEALEAPEADEEDDDVAEGIKEEWEFKKRQLPEIEVPEVEETPEEETDDIIESVEKDWEVNKRQVREIATTAPTVPSLPGHDAIIVDVSPEIEETPAGFA